MNDFKALILFCQAPADVPYILSIYEKNKKSRLIYIFIINVKNIYKFLNELNLLVEKLVFVPYQIDTFMSIRSIQRERRRIRNLKALYFSGSFNCEVYFFSRFEDWLTASFVGFLNKNNKIYYVDYYDFGADIFKKKTLTCKTLALKSILWILTGVNFKVNIMEKLPEFNIENYKNINRIKGEIDNSIFRKYGYKIENISRNQPVALAFISPCEDVIYESKKHDETQFYIFEKLKTEGYYVIVKGHPRLGVPSNITKFIDIEIPAYIPSEFIIIQNLSICIGIITSSIAHFAKYSTTPTYSLINLFEFKNPDNPEQYKKYLDQYSDYHILYFKDKNDFSNKLISYRNF